jgi:hypothetical protein
MTGRHIFAISTAAVVLSGQGCDREPKDGGFHITTDTMHLAIANYVGPVSKITLTHAVKFDGKYYCIFFEDKLYNLKGEEQHLFEISSDGTVEREIEMPDGGDYNIFVRNDSLVLTRKMRRIDETYVLSGVDKNEWVRTEDAGDTIYEDDKFQVICLNRYGRENIRFREKSSDREYEVSLAGGIVNRVDSAYFVTSPVWISKIADPTALHPVTVDYRTVKRKDMLFDGGGHREGMERVFGDTVWTDRKRPLEVATSFTRAGELYHLCVNPDSTYIARLSDGKMVPVAKVGKGVNVVDSHDSYRFRVQKDNSQSVLFDGDVDSYNSQGLIEIKENDIRVRHLRHDVDTLRYPGTDGFGRVLELVRSGFDGLTMSDVREVEKELGGVEMKNYGWGDSERYLHIEDSALACIVVYQYTEEGKVREISFGWTSTRHYNEPYPDETALSWDRCAQKISEIESALTALFGKPRIRELSKSSQELKWSSNGVEYLLSDDYPIRMEITNN